MLALLQLVRLPNLLIIALTQCMAAYCIPHNAQPFTDLRFWLTIAGTLCIAAAGYIVNDYVDVRIDLINKPGKVVVGRRISRRWTMAFQVAFNALGILMGLAVSPYMAFTFVICSLLLLLYSEKLKKQFLSGNLVIAFLTALTLFTIKLYDNSYQTRYILAYGLFAFLTTLIREIIKDAEDLKGDMAEHSHTLPIISGLRRTRYVVMVMLLLLAIGLSLFGFTTWPLLKGNIYLLFIPYLVFFLMVPIGIALLLLLKADVKTDFSKLSRLMKLIMVAGILSMLFIRS